MKTEHRYFHEYRTDTGLFTGRVLAYPAEPGIDEFVASCLPSGYGVREDVIDVESQRVDPETGELVDYQPPQPDADHEWIHDDENGNRVRRWTLKPEAVERRARKAAAITRIRELEAKLPRAMSEHLLGIAPSEEDIEAGAMTVEQIRDAIVEQRAIIQEADSSPTESADE